VVVITWGYVLSHWVWFLLGTIYLLSMINRWIKLDRDYKIDIEELDYQKRNEIGKSKVAEACATSGLGYSASWNGKHKRVEMEWGNKIKKRKEQFRYDIYSLPLTAITDLFKAKP